MNESGTFGEALAIASASISQMVLIAALGYLFAKRKWLSQRAIFGLNRLLIDGVTPCALMIAMVRSFDLQTISQSWSLIVISTGWMLASIGMSLLFFRLWHRPQPAGESEDRAVSAMTGIQNSVFLPLPVALAVTLPMYHSEVTVYVTMVLTPAMLLQWTVGVHLLAGRKRPSKKDRLILLFNPPLMGVLVGAVLAFVPGLSTAAEGDATAWVGFRVLFGAMDMIGQTLSPLAMIVLGAFIASSSLRGVVQVRHLIPLIGIRLLVIPAAVFAVLLVGWLSLPPLAAMVLVLEASSPPATNHALVAQRYGGKWQLVSSLMLIVHVVALVTMPVWLALALHRF